VQFSARNSRQKKWERSVVLAALLLFGVLAAVYRPQAWVFADTDTARKETARKLAERVAGIPGLHEPLRLEWHPDEKWPEGEAARWLEMLCDEFDRRALPMSGETNAAALAVYAEQTPTQVVLTARTQVGDRDEVRIVAVPRAALPPAETKVAAVRLERELLYESTDRILDAAAFPDAAEGGLGVLLYRNFEVVALRVDAKGELRQSVALNVVGLKPARDPHGEMAPRGGQVAVQLWGKACEFSWDAASEVKCHMEKTPAPTKSSWHMETVLASPCDEANWTVSEGGNDPTAREVLHLVPDGAIEGSSATLMSEFPGPVLNVNAGQGGSSALIVVRNLRTGNYEVYKIKLVCGD
jgi:hypothetical protein